MNKFKKLFFAGAVISFAVLHAYGALVDGGTVADPTVAAVAVPVDAPASSVEKNADATAGAPSNRRDVVEYWAPVWYQDVNTMPCETGGNGEPQDNDTNRNLGGMSDFFCAYDYDGDMIMNNNWNNLPNYVSDGLPAYVYYSVVETNMYWYIGYYDYHARDWDVDREYLGNEAEHENDLEVAFCVIQKPGQAIPGGGTVTNPYGRLVLVETMPHDEFFQYCLSGENVYWSKDGDDIDSNIRLISYENDPTGNNYVEDTSAQGHPIIYVQSQGHGPWADEYNAILSWPDSQCVPHMATTELEFSRTKGVRRFEESGFWDQNQGLKEGVVFAFNGRAEKGNLDDIVTGQENYTTANGRVVRREGYVGYELVNIAPLWLHRNDAVPNDIFGEYGHFRGNEGKDNAATMPWRQDDSCTTLTGDPINGDGPTFAGEHFYNPAQMVDVHLSGAYLPGTQDYFRYTYNPYPVKVKFSYLKLQSGADDDDPYIRLWIPSGDGEFEWGANLVVIDNEKEAVLDDNKGSQESMGDFHNMPRGTTRDLTSGTYALHRYEYYGSDVREVVPAPGPGLPGDGLIGYDPPYYCYVAVNSGDAGPDRVMVSPTGMPPFNGYIYNNNIELGLSVQKPATWVEDIDPPQAPLNVAAYADPGTNIITVSWDANTEDDMGGYIVRWGLAPGEYNEGVNYLGLADTSDEIDSLVVGVRYYIAVYARDYMGNVSLASDEVSLYLGSAPRIIDHQEGDNTVRRPPFDSSLSYEVSFTDDDNDLAAASFTLWSGPGWSGQKIAGPINVSPLAPSLEIDPNASIVDGMNWVTVNVADSTGQTDQIIDAFYILKDGDGPSGLLTDTKFKFYDGTDFIFWPDNLLASKAILSQEADATYGKVLVMDQFDPNANLSYWNNAVQDITSKVNSDSVYKFVAYLKMENYGGNLNPDGSFDGVSVGFRAWKGDEQGRKPGSPWVKTNNWTYSPAYLQPKAEDENIEARLIMGHGVTGKGYFASAAVWPVMTRIAPEQLALSEIKDGTVRKIKASWTSYVPYEKVNSYRVKWRRGDQTWTEAYEAGQQYTVAGSANKSYVIPNLSAGKTYDVVVGPRSGDSGIITAISAAAGGDGLYQKKTISLSSNPRSHPKIKYKISDDGTDFPGR